MKTIYVALAIALSTSAAQAQLHISKVAASGKQIKLDFIRGFNADCSPIPGEVTIRIKSAPRHGRVSVKAAHDFPNLPPNHPFSDCSKRRVAGKLIHYQAPRDFVGTETVVMEIFAPTGWSGTRTFTIQVR